MTVSINGGTLAFYNSVQQRCAEFASLPPSQHDAEIKRLSSECNPVLAPRTLMAIVERYAHHRVPDYSSLAGQLIEQLGRSKVRAMLASNHGRRDLK